MLRFFDKIQKLAGRNILEVFDIRDSRKSGDLGDFLELKIAAVVLEVGELLVGEGFEGLGWVQRGVEFGIRKRFGDGSSGLILN